MGLAPGLADRAVAAGRAHAARAPRAGSRTPTHSGSTGASRALRATGVVLEEPHVVDDLVDPGVGARPPEAPGGHQEPGPEQSRSMVNAGDPSTTVESQVSPGAHSSPAAKNASD